MAEIYEPGPAYCTTCGRKIEPDARFCDNCGAVIDPLSGGPTYAPGGYYPLPGAEVTAVEYMGFWIRVPAALIDGILLAVVNFLVGLALGTGDNPFGVIVNLAITWTYHVAFVATKGQTIGKMLLGIQVVDSRGNIPGIGAVLLRETVGKFLSTIAVFIGYLWVVWDKEKRGWHDHIGGTYVVRKQRAPVRR